MKPRITKDLKLILILLCVVTFYSCLSQNKTTHIYSIKGNDTLKLDVFTPKNIKKNDKLPTLLWMHGGGFSTGSRDYKDDAQLAKYAANHGYIGISISYRLLRKDSSSGFGCNCSKLDKLETFKQAVIDFMDAAKYIVEHAKTLYVDSTKIIAGGSSAGAEGSLNAVFMRSFFIDDTKPYNHIKFAGVFACAGAIVNANYMTKDNAIPAVLYHGTKDQLVPYASAPHHYCNENQPGYLILDGSKVIIDRLDELETSYYFNIVKNGMHEISTIPFDELDTVFAFFNTVIIDKKIIQTKVVKTKN